MKKTKIFIEAVPLVDKQTSGIPHALAGLVAALATNKKLKEKFEIVLVAPRGRLKLLNRWHGLESCTRKAIPIKFRIMNGLGRRGLLPPMDLLLGPGIYLFGNFFNWPLTKRSYSLTYIHDICFALYPEYVQPENQRSLAKNVPRYIMQTNYIITVSESARREITDNFNIDSKKVIVLYNGVNTNLYRPYIKREVAEVKKKYNLEDTKYFLFIGNIEPRKNLERLVKAMQSMPTNYALIIIGSDGWLNEKVFEAIEQAKESGHVIIKPQTYVPDEDVARLISGAIALVQPSLYEGFGMPVLEAMASKTPVVAASISSLQEVMGSEGFYCNPHSAASIASGMKRVANLTILERKVLTEKAYKRATQFTWGQSAEKLFSIIEKIDRDLK